MKPNGLTPVCEAFPCKLRRIKTSVLCIHHTRLVKAQISSYEWESLKAHWSFMRAGCTKVSSRYWKILGAYGFTMTKRWSHFVTFLIDMGERPGPHYRLKIKAGETEYNADNCYWGLR